MLLDFENLSSGQKLEVDRISTELKIEFEGLIKTIGNKNKDNKDFFFRRNITSAEMMMKPIIFIICV